MDERVFEIIRFEVVCILDIVGIDYLIYVLKRVIEFIGESEYGCLCFVMKYLYVDYLLDVKYNGKMCFRFSINLWYVIKNFELGILLFEERIEVVCKVVGVGYLFGFIVVLFYMYEGWEEGYCELFEWLYNVLKDMMILNLMFELI